MITRIKILLAVLLSLITFTKYTGAVPGFVNSFEKARGEFLTKYSGGCSDEDYKTAEAAAFTPSWTEAENFTPTGDEQIVINTETWKMTEIVFSSEKSYSNPVEEVEVTLILTGCGRRYEIPCFWNGGNEWRARFACPIAGEYRIETMATNPLDAGLNGNAFKVVCTEYSGELDVYKHGFVTTSAGEKYFTYNDGTPFFYLGDTHWSLGDETAEMVKIITAKRAEQGFTVFQSEPIGASFDMTDGITDADIAGFLSYDEKFDIIANAGLTHANAEFFFPAYMSNLINNHGGFSDTLLTDGDTSGYDLSDTAKDYLKKAARYWVARYGAYPVMWTLGQETDADFYASDTNHPEWNSANNPYKLLAEYIAEYDCYDHPLSAHQENAGKTTATNSVFNDVKEHNWFAAQWSPSKTGKCNYEITRDYWYNSCGKPVIDYEGSYCGLWTKNYGARMQGWVAYLSGMYGYGWGGHDTWSYLNIYDEENDSSDGVDTITSEEKKAATWETSLEYESSYQVGYMRNFLETTGWYNLIPRFDDSTYFVPCTDVYSVFASNEDNTEGVIYFYSFTDASIGEKPNAKLFGGVLTGTIGNLVPNGKYSYEWFNPVTGEYGGEGSFKATSSGTYYIGDRLCDGETVATDMVYHFTLK